jgi:ubiquinone biosynthesis protein Coq4
VEKLVVSMESWALATNASFKIAAVAEQIFKITLTQEHPWDIFANSPCKKALQQKWSKFMKRKLELWRAKLN